MAVEVSPEQAERIDLDGQPGWPAESGPGCAADVEDDGKVIAGNEMAIRGDAEITRFAADFEGCNFYGCCQRAELNDKLTAGRAGIEFKITRTQGQHTCDRQAERVDVEF